MNTNEIYEALLDNIYYEGTSQKSRGLDCREIINHRVRFDMNFPLITHSGRKVSFTFAKKEAEWMLSGRNDIFHVNMAKYSDDGATLSGAYGPKILLQIEYIVQTLRNDPGSRQAVITIWERNPPYSKDIPCTIGLQFMIRNGALHTTAYMRSSDAWLGIPYDLFSFSMVSLTITHKLNLNQLGHIVFMLGSSHIYATDFYKVRNLMTSVSKVTPPRLSLCGALQGNYFDEETDNEIQKETSSD